MSKNIVLIGLMGSGKTTIGKLLAQKLDKIFVDTDKLIETKVCRSINELFAVYGEGYFRDLESHAIEVACLNSNQIISTGGGAPINPDNLTVLKKNGVLFYLKAPAEELFNRIKNETNRPLLKNSDPFGTLEMLLSKRESFYNQADVTINTYNKPIDDIVNEIEERYKNYEC